MARKKKGLNLCMTVYEPGSFEESEFTPEAIRQLYPVDADGQHIDYLVYKAHMDGVLTVEMQNGLSATYVAGLLRKLARIVEQHGDNLLDQSADEMGRFDVDGRMAPI